MRTVQGTARVHSWLNNNVPVAVNSGDIFEMNGGGSFYFPSYATLEEGWNIWVKNTGTAEVLLVVNEPDLIDALPGYTMYPGEVRLYQFNGATITSIVVKPFYFNVPFSQNFIVPPGYAELQSDLVGGGGQGGSGRRGAAATARSGGAAGGTPARVVRSHRNLPAGTTIFVAKGAGGTTGGTAVTVDNTNGVDGQAGGNTTFGTLSVAYGGVGGKGGSTLSVTTTGSGGMGAGTSNAAGTAASGGLPSTSYLGGNAVASCNNVGLGGGGAGVGATDVGGCTEYGGAAAGAAAVGATTVTSSGSSVFGVSAASHGGWITASNTMPLTAGRAGLNGTYLAGGGALGGTCGAAPTVGADGADATTDDACGNPGAGGGATITAVTAAKAGGKGGFPGGAGGGGGAVLNGSLSGPGGAGADGRAIIKGVL